MKTPTTISISSFLLFLLFSTPWQFVQGQILNNENIRTAIDLWINNNSIALPMYGNIGTWDTSNVTSLNLAFWSTSNFAEDLSNWDVTRVTSMQSIFSKATNVNADVSKWQTSALANLEFAFAQSEDFSSDVSGWDTSKVTSLEGAFWNSKRFAGAGAGGTLLNNWNTALVQDMEAVFYNADWFTTDLCWDLTTAVPNWMAEFSCLSPGGGLDCSCFPMGDFCSLVNSDCDDPTLACQVTQTGTECPVTEDGAGGGGGGVGGSSGAVSTNGGSSVGGSDGGGSSGTTTTSNGGDTSTASNGGGGGASGGGTVDATSVSSPRSCHPHWQIPFLFGASMLLSFVMN